ncbi:MAG TPA: hypothetical protein VGY57_04995, partial [Vicinamibacterales bacterium]|nr:hypothetical protein [Vicinamibacterales bacterium]
MSTVLLVAFAASSIAVAAAAAAAKDPKRPGTPPPVLNVVHHKLKRGAPVNYQALEANIVSAYERGKVQRFYWMTFQSTKDARDILYLNLANTAEEFNGLADAWAGVSTAHPELPRMQQRLAKLIESQTSTLTRRRDDVEYARTDVDFSTMRALLLTTFHVKAGHEGRFVEAVRRASGSHAPWVLYEANEESTFVLVTPLKSRAEAARAAPVPRAVRELRGVFKDLETRVYVLMPAMSRLPDAFRRASASPQPAPASPLDRARGGRPPSPSSSSPSS